MSTTHLHSVWWPIIVLLPAQVAVAFSSDGGFLLAAAGSKIRAFELANGIAPKRSGVSDAYVRDAHTIPTIAFLKKYTRHISEKKESLEDDSSFL